MRVSGKGSPCTIAEWRVGWLENGLCLPFR